MTKHTPFTKLLIANRGEIAIRVMRTARQMGIATVAVYSEADAGAEHVRFADESVCIGGAASADSYLRIDRIIEAAQATGAGAIHPGYGFLAENDQFADAIADAGLIFVGPSAEVIRNMGDKAGAKALMQGAGMPCVPGYQGDDQSVETLQAEADKIGYPVMIKAVAGGGGRGMRLVPSSGEFADLLQSAKSEAKSAFGNDIVLLEKAIINPRHVEIQVMADRHGGAIHCGERDCSVQRRHQKVVEEAPSPAVGPELRERMGKASLDAVRAIGYEGAGTFEYLLDADGNFYFMEMNTRLQVEHPVSEAITGLDLVELQLRVAAGENLPVTQDDITFSGHAIEVRLCAEDPASGFMPQSGEMAIWRPDPALRVDHGLRDGAEIPVHYDSMVAKLIAHGSTREEARLRLLAGLERTAALGVRTNQAFLGACLSHPEFAEGNATTAFVEAHNDALLPDPAAQEAQFAMLIAAFLRAGPDTALTHGFATPVRLKRGDTEYMPRVQAFPSGACKVSLGDETLEITVTGWSGDQVSYVLNGTAGRATVMQRAEQVALHGVWGTLDFEDLTYVTTVAPAAPGSDGKVRASMNGAVVSVDVAVGDTVEAGQKVLVLEAMKMEHTHTTVVAGTVAAVHVAQGDQVNAHAVVVEVTPAEADT